MITNECKLIHTRLKARTPTNTTKPQPSLRNIKTPQKSNRYFHVILQSIQKSSLSDMKSQFITGKPIHVVINVCLFCLSVTQFLTSAGIIASAGKRKYCGLPTMHCFNSNPNISSRYHSLGRADVTLRHAEGKITENTVYACALLSAHGDTHGTKGKKGMISRMYDQANCTSR